MNLDDLTIGQAKELAARFSKCATKPEIHTGTGAALAERAVLVTTAHRGVFFGYATDVSGETIKLRSARNILYWPAENHGYLGLASDGPAKGSRVGPAANIEIRNITCVAECSEAAIKAWESSPWSK